MIKDIIFYVFFFTLSFLAGHFLPSYFKRKGQNRADKEDVSDIKYLEEKGKNLATKEDIAELTNSIESIKSEISYSNQRQHNIIESRNKKIKMTIVGYVTQNKERRSQKTGNI